MAVRLPHDSEKTFAYKLQKSSKKPEAASTKATSEEEKTTHDSTMSVFCPPELAFVLSRTFDQQSEPAGSTSHKCSS